jgi:hypothetical protein
MLAPMPRDPSEVYDPHLDARLCYEDAIAAIRMRKIASGEIKPMGKEEAA